MEIRTDENPMDKHIFQHCYKVIKGKRNVRFVTIYFRKLIQGEKVSKLFTDQISFFFLLIL